MHPQLIPERHPMCGKYMIALVKCREANPVRKFLGECNDLTYMLTKCLSEEKKVLRAPRQAKFQAQWAAKRAENEARMAELEAEAQKKTVAQPDGTKPGSPDGAGSAPNAPQSPSPTPGQVTSTIVSSTAGHQSPGNGGTRSGTT